jgi:hypothetical protein
MDKRSIDAWMHGWMNGWVNGYEERTNKRKRSAARLRESQRERVVKARRCVYYVRAWVKTLTQK